VLTLVNTGQAETPDFGHVNFTPGTVVNGLQLIAGQNVNLTVPLMDPTGTVFLCYGEFTQGYLRYLFDVIDPANTLAQVILPDVVNDEGLPLQIQNNQFGTWQTFNLPDYHLGIKDAGLIQDSLRFVFSVQSDLPAGTPVGTVSIDLDNQFGFRVFQGYLYDYVRALEGVVSTININYPYDIENAIHLAGASVYIEVTNEVGFSAEFHGSLRAINNRTGETRIIPVVDAQNQPYVVEAATLTGPTITELDFTGNITELLQIMPDTIEIFDSYLLINGGHNGFPGFVEEHQRIRASYQINAPFVFELYDHSFELDEVTQVEMEEDARETIRDRLLEASLTLGIVNRVPVGAAVTMFVSTDPVIDTDDPGSYNFSKTLAIHAASSGSEPGAEEAEQIVELAMNKSELDVFTNPFVYLTWIFTFEPSNGPVTIYARPTDYIQIRGMISARLHLSEDM